MSAARDRSRTPAALRAAAPAAWEVRLDHGWVAIDGETARMLSVAQAAGERSHSFQARGSLYMVDFDDMQQVNLNTGYHRPVRCRPAMGLPEPVSDGDEDGDEDYCEDDEEDASEDEEDEEEEEACDDGAEGVAATGSGERASRLLAVLLSSAVQVPEPAGAELQAERLRPEEVAKLFAEKVPGVQSFLYRRQAGNYALEFIKSAYRSGLGAFQGTALHQHLLSMFRLVVHHGWDGGQGSAKLLRDVAEAFMDCQAVQARAIERAGLQLCGVVCDFKGQLVSLVSDYKSIAMKMLTALEIRKLGGPDDHNDPAHYENRLIADLGDELGLDRAEIRRARLDVHAEARFRQLHGRRRQAAANRLRDLFDLPALLKALAAEVNSLSADSSRESTARLFIDWASERMGTHKHLIFDEDDASRVEVGDDLALTVLEVVFLGSCQAPAEATWRGVPLGDIFRQQEAHGSDGVPEASR